MLYNDELYNTVLELNGVTFDKDFMKKIVDNDYVWRVYFRSGLWLDFYQDDLITYFGYILNHPFLEVKALNVHTMEYLD